MISERVSHIESKNIYIVSLSSDWAQIFDTNCDNEPQELCVTATAAAAAVDHVDKRA